ncbi:Hypothetical predicted protein, partial [Pelobates cultripes]
MPDTFGSTSSSPRQSSYRQGKRYPSPATNLSQAPIGHPYRPRSSQPATKQAPEPVPADVHKTAS